MLSHHSPYFCNFQELAAAIVRNAADAALGPVLKGSQAPPPADSADVSAGAGLARGVSAVQLSRFFFLIGQVGLQHLVRCRGRTGFFNLIKVKGTLACALGQGSVMVMVVESSQGVEIM